MENTSSHVGFVFSDLMTLFAMIRSAKLQLCVLVKTETRGAGAPRSARFMGSIPERFREFSPCCRVAARMLANGDLF
jgi:hypothetical protein